VRHGHTRQQLERGVVPDLAPLDDAAVAVRRVLAEADVGHHEQVLARGPDGAHRLLHDTVLRVSLASRRVLPFGKAEQDDAGDPQPLDLLRLPGRLVDGQVEAARQRRNLAPQPGPRSDEERVDQL
jgi:hypothetical protein